MKIGIVPDTLGIIGTSVSVQSTARCLEELGQDVTYILVEAAAGETRDEAGRKLVRTGSFRLKDLAAVMDTFDAVLISNGVFMPFSLEASRFTRKALVCEILHFNATAGLTPSVDITIAVSEYIYREMQPREHDILIPNGIDFEAFRPLPRPAKDRVRIIQVAAAAKTMDPDLEEIGPELIAEGLPIEVHLAGRNGSSGDDRVVYHGVVEHHCIPSLVAESDMLLHMSETDTFGLAPVEAMSVGTIPIVSRVGGLPYSVEDGVSGFVMAPGDREGVKQLIRDLVRRKADEPDTVERLQENGMDRAAARFDVRKNTADLLAHLQKWEPVLPRANRSSGYPFSLIAPTAFFLQFQSDAFIEAFAEIFHAGDLAEAFRNWREFLGFAYKRYHNYRHILLSLDRIYDRMIADAKNRPQNVRNVYLYWLAALAAVLDRPRKAVDYLLAGAPPGLTGNPSAREHFIDGGLAALKAELTAAFGSQSEPGSREGLEAFKNVYFSGGAM